jgi:hypothetical protein
MATRKKKRQRNFKHDQQSQQKVKREKNWTQAWAAKIGINVEY